mmetsp:Transcript_11741/g.36466  ORF Transcript_11741/g.36466 Transcript_11741/m.36466 type:complete len:531 (-) Transcript_11741:679-2271(-)
MELIDLAPLLVGVGSRGVALQLKFGDAFLQQLRLGEQFNLTPFAVPNAAAFRFAQARPQLLDFAFEALDPCPSPRERHVGLVLQHQRELRFPFTFDVVEPQLRLRVHGGLRLLLEIANAGEGEAQPLHRLGRGGVLAELCRVSLPLGGRAVEAPTKRVEFLLERGERVGFDLQLARLRLGPLEQLALLVDDSLRLGQLVVVRPLFFVEIRQLPDRVRAHAIELRGVGAVEPRPKAFELLQEVSPRHRRRVCRGRRHVISLQRCAAVVGSHGCRRCLEARLAALAAGGDGHRHRVLCVVTHLLFFVEDADFPAGLVELSLQLHDALVEHRHAAAEGADRVILRHGLRDVRGCAAGEARRRTFVAAALGRRRSCRGTDPTRCVALCAANFAAELGILLHQRRVLPQLLLELLLCLAVPRTVRRRPLDVALECRDAVVAVANLPLVARGVPLRPFLGRLLHGAQFVSQRCVLLLQISPAVVGGRTFGRSALALSGRCLDSLALFGKRLFCLRGSTFGIVALTDGRVTLLFRRA